MRRISLLILALCLSASLFAAPARPGTIRLTQPDGTVVLAMLKGDENYRILTDMDGHALIKDETGYYCYARYEIDGKKVSTGWVAGKKAPDQVIAESMMIPHDLLQAKAAEKRMLADSERENVTMSSPIMKAPGSDGDKRKKKCIVVLANYADTTMKYTQSHFEALFNQPNYSFEGAKGSVYDYFHDQLPEYEFTFVVSPIVTLPEKQSYYGGESDSNAYKAVVDACKLVDPYVDFSEFDGNGNHEVDNVFLILAGTDEAESGNEDAIWAHQYYLKYSGVRNLNLDGVRINTYTICAELARRSDYKFRLATIGTFCHEYGHTLGLMDMYDVDGAGSQGRAEALNYYTGIMDCGCYNDDGLTPAHYNAIDYDSLGYGECEELSTGSYTLEPISEKCKYYKMPTNVEGEYYLVECRNNKGWDTYIQGKGLAIYHIDRSSRPAGVGSNNSEVIAKDRWYLNSVNNNPNHQCADMIEPDYKSPAASRAFFPWNKVNTFTPITKPSFRFWDNSPSPLSITDITLGKDGIASFNVVNTEDIIHPTIVNLKKTAYQHTAFITFGSSIEDAAGTAIVKWGVKGGEMTEETLEQESTGQFSLLLEELNAGTDYSVTVKISYGGGIESPEADCSFSTYPADAHGEPYIFLGSDSGRFAEGQDIPLVVFNDDKTSDIRWYLDSKPIYPSKNGTYKTTKSGILKAVLKYSNGDTETIKKYITVE